MAKKTPLLTVTDLTKAFGNHVVVDSFNLEVAPGQAVALVGRNGAGKSTILRCLVGVDRPTSGEIQLCGRRMDERDPQVRSDMAVVIDDIDFFPDLSVVEHLDLLARAHSVEDPDAVVDQVLADVDLVAQSGQLPMTLSSGQRRRLALATIFVRPRLLLVLDEPEQRLDVEGVAWLGRRLRAERDRGVGIVMASHDPELVAAVGADVVTIGPAE